MELNISVIILLCLGVILLGALIDQAAFYLDNSKNSVSNESINFAANNTCYNSVRTPLSTISNCYDDADHTNTYLAAQSVICDASRIKVLTNGTGGYPNMTTGTHYCDYTIYKPTGIGGTVVGLMVAVFVLALILIYLGVI